jgi:pyruvate dehydrogenase E2 component (dihydrolipoamide acetyltransferase)
MAYEFRFPDVGEGISEGEIVKWRVKEGDTIKQDQVIVEIETDKAIVEIPSPKAGKIVRLHAKEGEVVKVGSVLVTIAEAGVLAKEVKKAMEEREAVIAEKEEVAQRKEAVPAKKQSFGVVGSLPEYEEEKPVERKEVAIEALKEQFEAKEVKALPAIRKLAEEKKVDLTQITPTGKHGEITKDDVIGAAKKTTPASERVAKIIPREYDLFGYTESIPLKGVRKTIAKRLTESHLKTVPVTSMDEADITHLVEIREREKAELEKESIKLTYIPFVIKALIRAFKKHPILNANFDDEKEAISVKKYYNIGVAVDTADGLIVPVVKIADKKTIKDIARELMKLSQKARDRSIDLGDLRGGTFTITNIGSIGGTFATPIINYPEVAILLTGRIYDKVVSIGGKPKVRKVLPLSLTFDHRVTDGAEVARFMNDLKEILENPDDLLLDFM